MPVIAVADLVKHYGKVQALNGVTLAVERGEIFGLLGQNGAGKTTFVKVLLGLVRKTSGVAKLLERSVGEAAVRARVGFLPEGHDFPDYHTATSALDFYGMLYGLSRGDRRRRAAAALDLVGLGDRARAKIRTFSKGMKQRLGIAHAVFHDPEVIFFDEPTDGVDPGGRREVRDLMLRLKGQGKTIFLNSHLLQEVELVCDRVGVLHFGRLVRTATVDDLTRFRNVYRVTIDGALPADFAARWPSATASGGVVEVRLEDPKEIDAIVDFLRARQVSIRAIEEKRVTLEEAFLALVA